MNKTIKKKSTLYGSALYLLRIHMLRRFCTYLRNPCSEGSAHIKNLYHLSFSFLERALAIFEFCRSEVVISVRASKKSKMTELHPIPVPVSVRSLVGMD